MLEAVCCRAGWSATRCRHQLDQRRPADPPTASTATAEPRKHADRPRHRIHATAITNSLFCFYRRFPRHGSGASRSAWRPACADSVPALKACPYRLPLTADRAQKSTPAAFSGCALFSLFLVCASFRRTGTDGDGRRVCWLGPVRCPSGTEELRVFRREAESGSRF